ncbi:MAG: TPM domain-containing protein [Saprospiraceae bacterium]|nr:TPM domain-containing protein [Saprospiraceae bacterium]
MKCVLSIFIFCGLITVAQAQVFTLEAVPDPKQTPSNRFVSNPSRILSDASVIQINQMLTRLEDSTTVQVAVVALPSIGDAVPKDFAHDLFAKWGIGYQGKNNGLLILLVTDQRRVEFETGYGLEGVLPDITCSRIQRNEMLPSFRQGDYSTGMLNGITKVVELLEKGEAVEEVYDRSKFGGTSDDGLLNMTELWVIGVFFSVFLFLLWLIRWIIRASNPVKGAIDSAIYKNKKHAWYGITWYFIIPMAIVIGFSFLADSIDISFDHALVCMYAYLAFILWDARQRKELKFKELYGKMSEPDQYVRMKSALSYYWFDALLFPVPMIWLWLDGKKNLNALRNHPRTDKNGHPLFKLSDNAKKQYLTAYQLVEDSLHTIEYDVWRNEQENATEVVAYVSMTPGKYKRCDACNSIASRLSKTETLEASTTSKKGKALQHYGCKACGHTYTKEIELPLLVVNSNRSGGTSYTSSGRSWGGGSSGGGSSWGGGFSGGGGAGSSW